MYGWDEHHQTAPLHEKEIRSSHRILESVISVYPSVLYLFLPLVFSFPFPFLSTFLPPLLSISFSSVLSLQLKRGMGKGPSQGLALKVQNSLLHTARLQAYTIRSRTTGHNWSENTRTESLFVSTGLARIRFSPGLLKLPQPIRYILLIGQAVTKSGMSFPRRHDQILISPVVPFGQSLSTSKNQEENDLSKSTIGHSCPTVISW